MSTFVYCAIGFVAWVFICLSICAFFYGAYHNDTPDIQEEGGCL
jgi:hypothetical protein